MNSRNKNKCFILLAVFFALILTGCRQSPLLEQIIYVDRVQPPPKVQDESMTEKPETPVEPEMQNPITVWQAAAPEITTGGIEFGADSVESGAAIQIVTDGGIVVEVPESRTLVTTVSETTQNPHWKSSIDYESDRYDGERKDGFFNGQGTYHWDDGEKYEGEWQNGMFGGQGTYNWDNGDRYEGGWKTECFDGLGTYTWASGSFYQGEWKSGVKEGQGTYTWANGDGYTGEWKAGVKEGFGTYTWADGSIYEGEWKYGIKDGMGTYRGADGTIYQGEWKNDKFVQ